MAEATRSRRLVLADDGHEACERVEPLADVIRTSRATVVGSLVDLARSGRIAATIAEPQEQVLHVVREPLAELVV